MLFRVVAMKQALRNIRPSKEIDRFLIHPYTNMAKQQEQGPLVIVRGEGVRVFDEDGKEYIEGLAGMWSVSLGFSESELVKAAQRQFEQLPFYHGFHAKSTRPMMELAERLAEMSPVPEARIFFANSGSEINDTVVKLIWHCNNLRGLPNKKKIISRRRSYHGVTIAMTCMTGTPMNHADFDRPIDRFIHCMCPDFYREGRSGETEEQFTDRCIEDLRTLIDREGANTIAAFVADPVLGGGGVVTPPKGYFAKVQALLRRHDILFVVDEVICGFGRTGDMFACDTYELQPDVVTVAKALSSSYMPISAAMVSPAIWRELIEGSRRHGSLNHGFTYSGHPVAAAVALRTLELMEEHDVIRHVRLVAPHFQQRLEALRSHPLVGDVRGVGLLGGIEFVASKESKAPFDKTAGVGVFCTERSIHHGLIVRSLGDIMAFCPPLIITRQEIDEMFDRFALALADTTAMARQEKLI
jgi:4-aminobutyrate---pyruvate transaminase